MARFYASIQGSARTEATRTGSRISGIQSHTRGWELGVRVCGGTDGYDGEGREDVFHVYATSGSNGRHRDILIAVVKQHELRGPIVIELPNNGENHTRIISREER